MPVVLKPLISKQPFPLVIARAVPPSELSKNSVVPPAPLTGPPLLVIVALPALDVNRNTVIPPAPLTAAPLLVIAALPALDAPSTNVAPGSVPRTEPPSLAPLL